MRIVVTGGLGFLGSNLVVALLKQGHQVVIVDPGYSGSMSTLEALAPNMPGVPMDWSNCMAVKVPTRLIGDREAPYWGEIANWRPDRIYHLGAEASPPAYKAHPVRSLWAGSLGTHAVMDLAKHAGARVLLASSSEVYGDPETSPQQEDYRGSVSTTGPRACYDEAKRYMEAYGASASQEMGVDVRIARIFNTYGPGMSLTDGRMIPEFVRCCLEQRPIEVHGDGEQRRTLCYVSDTVAGLMALMEAPEVPPAWPVNIGGAREQPVNQIAEQICMHWEGITGAKASPIHHVEQPCPHDPKHRQPDTSRAWELLSWSQQIPNVIGLPMTIRWLISQYSKKD